MTANLMSLVRAQQGEPREFHREISGNQEVIAILFIFRKHSNPACSIHIEKSYLSLTFFGYYDKIIKMQNLVYYPELCVIF